MRHKIFFISLISLVLIASSVCADSSHKGNIHPNIKLSFSERFRFVSYDNTISLSDSSNAGVAFTRHRTSMMAQWYFHKNFEFAVKMTNEFRHYFVPSTRKSNMHEIFFDQLYLKWKNEHFLPGTLTLGRQNIILGEGFVVLDGNPLDGSRSIYFNAIRYDGEFNAKNKLTVFYAISQAIDSLLPLINDQQAYLIEKPYEGFGLYYSGQHRKTNFHLYCIKKKVKDNATNHVESDINALGIRLHHRFNNKLVLTLEQAHQFGDYNEFDRSAHGGYVHLNYKTGWNNHLPDELVLGAINLSGDMSGTEKYEGWDPMFGRWPKWSESYIYTQKNENGVAWWTNYRSIFAGAIFKFDKDTKLNFEYHHMLSDENANFVSDNFFGDGNCRGGLFKVKFNYRLNKYLTGHVYWEYFNPGSYYNDNADHYNWLRTELMFKI